MNKHNLFEKLVCRKIDTIRYIVFSSALDDARNHPDYFTEEHMSLMEDFEDLFNDIESDMSDIEESGHCTQSEYFFKTRNGMKKIQELSKEINKLYTIVLSETIKNMDINSETDDIIDDEKKLNTLLKFYADECESL